MCERHSYNKNTGSKPEAVLIPPTAFGFTYSSGKEKTKVSIDACIANVIQHLWDKGILTTNSCCGHGKENPSIVMQSGCSKATADTVRKHIAEVDPREFDILAWQLCAV